ncbi:MAG TPA: glycosyltransferase family 4 protein [Myxococcales bacterium]|nr:glycosyltransferase family 4 protein [Myxococcales bacterium]
MATHVEELFHAVRAGGARCEVLDIGKGQLPADGVVPAGGMARFSALLGAYAARGFRIHVHTSGANPRSWMLAQACAAAGRLSGGALITLHSGLLPAWLEEAPSRAALARAVLVQFAHVIAVSEPIRDALRRCGLDGVTVLPAFSREFVKPSAPPPGLAEVRARARPLYCAMIAPRPEYGAGILLDAFAQVRGQLPGAALALYGPGSESVAAEGVHAFGELHRPQALALMAACDVFVRPTLADGDSVSVREALALGCAVVATSVGHRPAGVRLVPPGAVAPLAGALVEAAGEIAARPERAAGAAAAGSLRPILSLYGVEAACAASAVS